MNEYQPKNAAFYQAAVIFLKDCKPLASCLAAGEELEWFNLTPEDQKALARYIQIFDQVVRQDKEQAGELVALGEAAGLTLTEINQLTKLCIQYFKDNTEAIEGRSIE